MRPKPLPPESSSPLRVAVLGTGKIGSTFAFQLARAGRHDVTVIARPGSTRLRQLDRDGAIVDFRGERAAVTIASALDEQTPYDLVVVTLLAHQADPLLPALARSAAGCILFMFNTFHPERLEQAILLWSVSRVRPFRELLATGQTECEALVDAMVAAAAMATPAILVSEIQAMRPT